MRNRRVIVTTRNARVSIRAVDGATVSVVNGDLREVDGELEVTTRARAVEITVPTGTDVVVGVGSGRVECVGTLGSVSITSSSGRIAVEHGSEVDVRSVSGRVLVGRCDGICRAMLRSGAIEVGEAGAVDASTISGSIDIAKTSHANVRAISGRITIATGERPEVTAKAVSGSVRITVPRDTAPLTRLRSVSGSAKSDCDAGTDGSIDVSTRSGTIRVTERP